MANRRSDFSKRLGARIRVLRVEREQSQGSLAKRTGIVSSSLSRIEAGEVSPTIGTLIDIAEALGVTLHELLPETTMTVSEREGAYHPLPQHVAALARKLARLDDEPRRRIMGAISALLRDET